MLIMGPLDMKGLLGAGTVMGTLMYGAGHVWDGHANFYLHEHALVRAPTDEEFVQMQTANCCLTGPDFLPPHCRSSPRLCNQLPQSAEAPSYRCGSLAAMEVQCSPGQSHY